MKKLSMLALVALGAITLVVVPDVFTPRASAQAVAVGLEDEPDNPGRRRLDEDLTAMRRFRPGYAFWQHIFTIPDGSIAFGSAANGRLLAIFPEKGDWIREAVWTDPALAGTLAGSQLQRNLGDRREQVAHLLEQAAGPVLHNPTRGNFLLPNARRYGRFLGEWGAIYERFGVPAEVGLAQVILESGLNGTRRSEANAVGFCQWLQGNWKRLNRLAPTTIEGHNQTTQAPYCAAYLTVLATKYGSFIPALSEHNAGGTNVGRTLINGERLGGRDVRTRYFLGSKLARDLRALGLQQYRDLYRTYGPRSYLYAEMIVGNTFNVRAIMTSAPQVPIHAMRTSRAIPLTEITKRTGLSADEVRRFNPALVKRVPANANLYLPLHVPAFGRDVTFWHRPASAAYAATLDQFLRLDVPHEQWDDPSFEPVLREFQRRFRASETEEGAVMDTVLAYAMEDAYTSGRREMLAEFRHDPQVLRLLDQGLREIDAERLARSTVPVE
jgi:hypothetical protein